MKATRTCSIEGCDRKHSARGFCERHYDRLMHHGTTDLLPVLSAAERLAAGLERMPNGCLEWTGATNRAKNGDGGYGHIKFAGKTVDTHRVAWTLINGPIPPGLNVLHHCDNPPCCETEPSEAYPEGHLFLGTTADNIADKVSKGRQKTNGNELKTHCPARHRYTPENTYVDSAGRRACCACKAARYKRINERPGP